MLFVFVAMLFLALLNFIYFFYFFFFQFLQMCPNEHSNLEKVIYCTWLAVIRSLHVFLDADEELW